MNDNEIRLFGKLVSELRDLDQRRTEIFSEFLTEIGKPFMETATKTEKPTLNEINALKSTEKTSSKGSYRLIDKAENPDNAVFDKLQKYIAEKGGFVNLYNLKIWNFSNNPKNKIGYKKQ